MRIYDLFWIFDEKIIVDSLVHLLRLKKRRLLSMEAEEAHTYIRYHLVEECVRDFGIEKSLPSLNGSLEEREIWID